MLFFCLLKTLIYSVIWALPYISISVLLLVGLSGWTSDEHCRESSDEFSILSRDIEVD